MINFSKLANAYYQHSSYIAVFLTIIGIIIAALVGILWTHFIKNKNIKTPEESKHHPRQESVPLISGCIAEFLGRHGIIIKFGPLAQTLLKIIRTMKEFSYNTIGWRYLTPWYLMIGEEGSGKSSLINSIDLYQVNGQNDEQKNYLNWVLNDKLAILETPSQFFNEKLSSEKFGFWQLLTRLLLYFKPRRPLDGIIITLSAEELIAKEENTLTLKAQALFEKIHWLQKQIQFRVPIYLIVTKADTIDGFNTFTSALSPDYKRQIFGWSNKYNINQTFSSELIQECFESIINDLEKTQLSLELETNTPNLAEDNILLRKGIKEKLDTLSSYLKTLFRQNGDGLGLMFRGVYFTGQEESSFSQDNLFDAINVYKKHKLNFINDLFIQKILVESNLSTPIGEQAVFSLKNCSLITKISFLTLTAVTIISTTFTYPKLKQKCLNISNVLSQANHALTLLQREQNSSIQNGEHLTMSISRTLDLMSSLEDGEISSLIVPASWFSNIHTKIENALSTAFNHIVMRSMYDDLEINAVNIETISKDNRPNEPESLSTNLTETSAFNKLAKIVEYIDNLEQAGGDYNNIVDNGDNQIDIDGLTQYLFGKKYSISKGLKNHNSYKNLVFPVNHYKNTLKEAVIKTYLDFIESSLSHKIFNAFESVTNSIKSFEERLSEDTSKLSVDEIIDLIRKTEGIIKYLNSENITLLNKASFNAGSKYEQVMSKISLSRILGQEFTKRLQNEADKRLKAFKIRLAIFKTNLTGRLITIQNDKILLSPSEELIGLTHSLKTLINEPFVINVKPNYISNTIPQGKILLWNKKIITDAAELINKYEKFLKNQANNTNKPYLYISKIILRNTLSSLIANAQIFEDEFEDLSPQAQEKNIERQASNLADVMSSLLKVTLFLDRNESGTSSSTRGLSDIVFYQASELLDKIDDMFEREALYSFGSSFFNAWNIRENNNQSGFSSYSEDQLKSYLSIQRNRLFFISKNLAEPVMNILLTPLLKQRLKNPDIVEKWKDILEKVNEYEKHQPGNAILSIENLLLAKINNLSATDIEKDYDINNIRNYQGDEFFALRKKDLVNALFKKVQKTLISNENQVLERMLINYTKNLLNKFPFSSVQTIQEVDLLDLEAFLKDYEMLDDTAKKRLLNSSNKTTSDFIRSVIESYPFLKAWLLHANSASTSKPVLGFKVEFRVDRQNEIFADKIVDWNFSIDKKSLTVDSKKERLEWFSYEPVSLSLRWVFSSRQYPTLANNFKAYSLNGRTVKFTYEGAWSVLRMVHAHSSSNSVGSAIGETLKFMVPVSCLESNSNKRKYAQVFIKITALKNENGSWIPIKFPNLYK